MNEQPPVAPLPPDPNKMYDQEAHALSKKVFSVMFGAAYCYKLFFSFIFLIIITVAMFSFFIGPLLRGETVEYTLNGVPKVVNSADTMSLLVPGLFVLVFIGAPLVFVIHSIYKLYQLKKMQ